MTITVTFSPLPCDGGDTCPARVFSDLDPTQWYHEAIDYVLTHQLMAGVSQDRFAPRRSPPGPRQSPFSGGWRVPCRRHRPLLCGCGRHRLVPRGGRLGRRRRDRPGHQSHHVFP
ncbi:MAG: S-layer homology domain-containing protein [Evtepia gabavorous]